MRATVQGAAVEYDESGSGRTALLLHGNPDSRRVWKPLVERLSGAMRCVVPDLPGFGGSEIPAGFDFTLASQAGWVAGFLDAIGVKEPIDLIVHDVGGPYGFAWAVTQPERVRKIVAFNTGFTRKLKWHFWARVWRTWPLGEISMASMNWPLFRREIRRGGTLTDAQIRESYETLTPRARRGVLAWYRKMDPEAFVGWDDKLVALTETKPTLVVWGERDPYIAGGEGPTRFGRARVVRFSDSGHWPQAEKPEESAKEVLAHLG